MLSTISSYPCNVTWYVYYMHITHALFNKRPVCIVVCRYNISFITRSSVVESYCFTCRYTRARTQNWIIMTSDDINENPSEFASSQDYTFYLVTRIVLHVEVVLVPSDFFADHHYITFDEQLNNVSPISL